MAESSLKMYGRARANPAANANNFIKLADDCNCDSAYDVCQDLYTGTHADTVYVTGVSINGVVHTFPGSGILVDESDALEQAVLDLLTGEVNPYVDATYSGTTFTFRHYGASTVVLYITGSAVTMARTCNIANNCEYSLSVVGEVGDIGYNGETEALANNPYAWSDTDATALATAAELEDDLETALDALGVTYTSVTVTPNETTEEYDIVIVAASPLSLTSGSSTFLQSNCAQSFVA